MCAVVDGIGVCGDMGGCGWMYFGASSSLVERWAE